MTMCALKLVLGKKKKTTSCFLAVIRVSVVQPLLAAIGGNDIFQMHGVRTRRVTS